MKKTVFVLAFLCTMLFVWGDAKGPRFHYRFDKQVPLILNGGARIVNGILELDGANDFAQIPDSEKIHLTSKGFTLIGVVKMKDNGTRSGRNNAHDMIMSKGREFIFGRFCKRMYVNFHDGRSWCASTFSGQTPPVDKWCHYAAVFERFNDAAQGDVGYKITIYMNGDAEVRCRFLMVEPKLTNDLIEIGKGFGGGPWYLHGSVAEIAVYERALTDAQIAELFQNCPLVEYVRKGFTKVEEDISKRIDRLGGVASPQGKWLLEAVRRMASTGYPQNRLQIILDAAETLVSQTSLDTMAAEFNRRELPLRMFVNRELALLLAVGEGRGVHPLTAVWDRRNFREIFGEKSLSWTINARIGKKTVPIEYNDPQVSWKVSDVKSSDGRLSCRISWRTGAPAVCEAVSDLQVAGGRIESDFRVRSAETEIDSVTYPAGAFAKLKGGNDAMILPWMSGILVRDPMQNQFSFGQDGRYPSGRVSLQFSAYYDDLGGVYLGMEDGLARTKDYSAVAKRDNLNISWTSPVASDPANPRKADFRLNGKAVLQLYDGKWFEAGQIYRDFLEKKAVWWIRDLPRKSTAPWFRDNTLWLLAYCGNRDAAQNLLEETTYFRKYFDLPFGIHWYHWNDTKKAGWPHFPPKDFTLEYAGKFKKAGVYTMPYIDSRLWNNFDGPNRTDYMFTSHGLKYAAKRRDRSTYQEVYGKTSVYSVMCPVVPAWQKVIVDLTRQIADYGFDAVYHDQVATAAPKMCFDRSHGHLLNDGANWLEKGYWPMFRKIKEILEDDYPTFCHTTEEASEPYLQNMDGFMVWRWTDAGQIPLFQSIYSGRAQFVGRLFNSQRIGEYQSFFSKTAQQLVNAEQLGWFPVGEIRYPGEKQKFTKKLMHLRFALLPYFNEGRMMAPMQVRGTYPMERCKWGGVSPQIVEMPQIANARYQRQDGSEMCVFINTTASVASATFLPWSEGQKNVWRCREGAAAPVPYVFGERMILSPRTMEVWVKASRNEALRIQKTMQKIGGFTIGTHARKFSNGNKARKPQPKDGLFTVDHIVGLADCQIQKADRYVGFMQDGARISYGKVNFGAKPVKSLELTLAVSPAYQGGSIDLMIADKNGKYKSVGKVALTSTGGFHDFKPFKVTLKQPLTGEHEFMLLIHGSASCNVRSWKM